MKLRVWNSINFSKMDYYNVNDITDAVVTINNLATAQLKNKAITDNAFGLEVFNEEEQEWEEWYDEEGYDIEAYELQNGEAVLIEE